MKFKKVISASREMIMGAIFTGIALVIANSWGAFLTAATTKVVNDVRCSGKSKKSKDLEKSPTPVSQTASTGTVQEPCENQVTVWGTFFAALITSVFMSIVIVGIMLIRGNKHQSSRRLTSSSTSWQHNFDNAVYGQ